MNSSPTNVQGSTIDENKVNYSVSPPHHDNEHVFHFLRLPQPRTRTISETDRIAATPTFKGVIDNFCRNKGYGEITPADGSEKIFLHIADIDSNYCPAKGDIVTFKKALMPPKMIKVHAVHCKLVHLNSEQKHEHWND